MTLLNWLGIAGFLTLFATFTLLQNIIVMGIGPIIDAYTSELADNCTTICTAIDTEDGNVLRRTAHKLKGSGRNMGAILLGDITAKFEK
ncbi:MAG: Hpt domain-containing protein [Mariprofundaceae bacterium]